LYPSGVRGNINGSENLKGEQMSELRYSEYIKELYFGRGIGVYPENIKPGCVPFLPPPLHMDCTELKSLQHWMEVYPITVPCATSLGNRQIAPGKELFAVTDKKAAGHAEDDLGADLPLGDFCNHYHPHAETYLFIGTNPDDPQDLGGEIEIWLGAGAYAEKHMITKPSCVHMPAGLGAMPLVFRRVDRLILQVVIYDNPYYKFVPTGVNPPDFKP
jgi:hypothetical protein